MPSECLIISTGSSHSVKILLAICQAFAHVFVGDYYEIEKATGIGSNAYFPLWLAKFH